MKKPRTNFYSIMHNADGMTLLTDIYFNTTVDETIERLKDYQKRYAEYDYLTLEDDDDQGYWLTGYVRRIKEHDMVVINCSIPHTNIRLGDEGVVVHISKDNTYEVEFKDNSVHTVKSIMLNKK